LILPKFLPVELVALRLHFWKYCSPFKKFSWKFLKVGNSKKALFTREREFGVSFKFNNTIDSEMNEYAEFRGYDNHLKAHQS